MATFRVEEENERRRKRIYRDGKENRVPFSMARILSIPGFLLSEASHAAAGDSKNRLRLCEKSKYSSPRWKRLVYAITELLSYRWPMQ